jgi:plasmid stability protein
MLPKHYRSLMPAILLKDVPPGLHRRLKLRAAAERRSLQQETMLVLEHGLSVLDGFPHNDLPPPEPMKTEFRLTDAFLEEIKRERDARR